MSEDQSAAAKLTELVGTPLYEIKEEFISVAEMQNRIMPDPHQMTVFGDFDLFGMTLPTAIVGGDFFDFINIEDRFKLQGRMGIVIADAARHGLSAAMLIRDFNTALFTAISFQAHYLHETTPLLFDKINRRMCRSSLPNQFISAFYAELHLDGTIRYINAGHHPPLISMDGDFVELDVGGPVLGAIYDLPQGYRVGESRIEKGETLVCYTDGIIETLAPEGTEYGVERIKSVIRKSRELSSRQLFNALIEDVENFSQGVPQSDDRTLIVIKRPEA